MNRREFTKMAALSVAATALLGCRLPTINTAVQPPSSRVVHCHFDLNPNIPGERMLFWDEPDHGDGLYCMVRE